MALVVGVRWPFGGKDAGSLPIAEAIGATEDAASGRPAPPGGLSRYFAKPS